MHADLWSDLIHHLNQNTPLAIATIATSDGSTPRNAGAKMLVSPQGLVSGTLGGGSAEAKALEIAQETLSDGKPRLFAVDMSGSAKTGADLICGGTVRIFIQKAEPAFAGIFQTLHQRLQQGLDSFLMTPLAGWTKPILLTPETIVPELAETIADGENGARIISHKGAEFLWEPLPALTRLVLAGGGHVSRATAQIASLVGFDVTILDDRNEFANPARFPWLLPSHIKVTPEFHHCLREDTLGFSVTKNCCIAILTRGHSYDSEVLLQALDTPAGYIGMIGSRHKREAVYQALQDQGVSKERLKQVHSPIGLAIGSETPEEIAVSIVAELIAARAKAFSENA